MNKAKVDINLRYKSLHFEKKSFGKKSVAKKGPFHPALDITRIIYCLNVPTYVLFIDCKNTSYRGRRRDKNFKA